MRSLIDWFFADGTAIVTLLVSTIFAVAGAVLQRNPARAEKVPLEEKIEAMKTSASSMLQLNREVHAELELQSAKTAELQANAKRAEALLALKKEEREAVESVMAGAVDRANKRGRRSQWLQNLFFFIAGVGASIAVTLFVRPL